MLEMLIVDAKGDAGNVPYWYANYDFENTVTRCDW